MDTLDDVGRKCAETWNVEFRFELNGVPLGLDQPVVLFGPSISRHPGVAIIPVKILGPPHTPPMGASSTHALVLVYNVMTGRKMNVILGRNVRLPVPLQMVNTEWDGDFRPRFLGADCPTSLYMYWLDSQVTYRPYVLAFDANPPGAIDNPANPPIPPFPARQNGAFPTRIPPRLNLRSRVRTPRNSNSTWPHRTRSRDTASPRGKKRSRSPTSPQTRPIGKARAPTPDDSRTNLGPRLPPQPAVRPQTSPAKPAAPSPSFTASIPEITPIPRVNYLLNRLEQELDADQQAASPPAPTSKAVHRGKKRSTPASPSRPHSPPATRRRYGPHTSPVPIALGEEEEETVTPEGEIPFLSNEVRLEQVIGFWRQLSSPAPDSPIIIIEAIRPQILSLLKKGRALASLAQTMGINPAAKRSRQIARNKGKSFDGFQKDFAEAVQTYNLEVIRLRGIACASSPNFGASNPGLAARR